MSKMHQSNIYLAGLIGIASIPILFLFTDVTFPSDAVKGVLEGSVASNDTPLVIRVPPEDIDVIPPSIFPTASPVQKKGDKIVISNEGRHEET